VSKKSYTGFQGVRNTTVLSHCHLRAVCHSVWISLDTNPADFEIQHIPLWDTGVVASNMPPSMGSVTIFVSAVNNIYTIRLKMFL
jgi:hypothetical protein